MRRDSFNVLFFIKKTKLLKNGEASVCMRITVNGARVETNIRKSIEPVSCVNNNVKVYQKII